MPKPVGIERGTQELAGPVLHADHEGAATWRVGEARHLVGQLRRGGEVVWLPWLEQTITAAAARFLLAVHALTFGCARYCAAAQLVDHRVDELTELRSGHDEIDFRLKRQQSSPPEPTVVF